MSTTEAGHPPLPMTRTRKLDPPPQFDAWRAGGPIHSITLWNGETAWALFGHEGVRAVLRDDKTFRSLPSTPGFPTINAADKATKSSALLSMLDAPEHTVLRDVVRQEFTLRKIREHKKEETELLVERLLDDMAAQALPAELIAALAAPVPARFTCRLLGVPYEDADFFTECIEVHFASGSPATAVYRVEDRLGKYFGDLVADRLVTPRDDMASRVAEQVRAGTITEEAAARLLHVLLIGGFDTTKQMISLGTLILLRNPDQLALLMADHDLWPRAIEELLRYLSVVQVERWACTVDTQIAGQVIRAGEGVLVMFNAANRDPRGIQGPGSVRHPADGSPACRVRLRRPPMSRAARRAAAAGDRPSPALPPLPWPRRRRARAGARPPRRRAAVQRAEPADGVGRLNR
jgi:cytochrome P450